MESPMLEIRRSWNRLVFNMGVTILLKYGIFVLRRPPDSYQANPIIVNIHFRYNALLKIYPAIPISSTIEFISCYLPWKLQLYN